MIPIPQFITDFTVFAKSNPWVGLPLTAWLLAVGTMIFKSAPMHALRFIRDQSTTTLIFDTTYNVGHTGTFEELMTWFSTNRFSSLSRTIRIYFRWIGGDGVEQWQRMPVAGMSESSQLVIWEGRPCLIKCVLQGSEKALLSDATPYIVTIVRLGRDRSSLLRMIEEFRSRAAKEKPVRRKLVGADWQIHGSIRYRPLDTVVTNDDVVGDVVKKIRDFEASEQWYVDHGIPYKLCFCLHGLPGTGKNSIISAVACELQRGIDSVNVNLTSDVHLSAAINSSVGSKSFILFDDFDSVQFKARSAELRTEVVPTGDTSGNKTENVTAVLDPNAKDEKQNHGLSRHGLLSLLDGEDTPHGRVFFLTTNDLKNVDKAITRKGRVDHLYYIGLLEHDAIVRYLIRQFGSSASELCKNVRFADLSGSELESKYKQHANSLQDMFDSIPQERPSGVEALRWKH